MTDIGKLREESGSLDRVIQAQSRALARMLQEQGGSRPDARRRYPASAKQMQKADAAQRALHRASSRLNELCWQREIKREILCLLEQANTYSARASSI
jgi:hypothetical protein